MPGLDKPVLLVGRESMNRTVNGDVVVVEIFPKAQWKAPGEEVVDQDCKSLFLHVLTSLMAILVALKDDDAEDDEGAGLAEKEQEKEDEEKMDVEEVTRKRKRDIQPTGRVVGVVKRNWRA